MSVLVAQAARSSAAVLARDLGPDLAAEVEVALADRADGQRPDSYLDAVSLGSLIVSIATLAWTVYNDQRGGDTEPSPDTIERQIRITLRDQDIAGAEKVERITEVVASQIIRLAEGTPAVSSPDKRLRRRRLRRRARKE